jgi:hypothetical protein
MKIKCSNGIRAACLLGTSLLPLTAVAEQYKLMVRAQPDECFYGVGNPKNEYPIIGNCESPAKLKTNESYIWAMTKARDDIYFGTVVNPLCSLWYGIGNSFVNDFFACEGSKSSLGSDNRPPGIYRYNDVEGLISLVDAIGNDPEAKKLLEKTYGIRAAGYMEDMVLLAGPGVVDGVIFFAFDATTDKFISAMEFTEYTNVRKAIVSSDKKLYFGVSTNEGTGAVLRWIGDKTDPFVFEVVGIGLDGDAVELAEHEGRLYATTWPTYDERNQKGGGLWMSPPLESLSSQTPPKSEWVRLWSASDYEPDPVTARTYGGGALASFDGWLYWGTMHVPFLAVSIHSAVYGYPLYSLRVAPALAGTWRASSVFRARNLDTDKPEIQLLYGGSGQRIIPPGYFQAYLCLFNMKSCNPSLRTWQIVPNKMGLKPIYGVGGLGNPYNNYVWTMEKWKDRLYLGTMDNNLLIYDTYLPKALRGLTGNLGKLSGGNAYGGDLFRFDSTYTPATPVNLGGMGNPLNYGFRAMIPNGDDSLLLGTANPMNLNSRGGWELIKMTD